MIYVISDIHGEYEKFIRLLEKISFSDRDTLYVLGDVLDRGPHPVKVLLKMMEMPNVIPIAGNHEVMGITCLQFLLKEITEETVSKISEEMIGNLLAWQQNGSKTTTDEFRRLSKSARREIIAYIGDFSAYEEVTAGGKSYVLVHAGLENFSPDKPLCDYTLDELVWNRTDFERVYYPDRYLVTGHTPTQLIEANPRPGYIYKVNHHIAIDCGACFGGRLAAYCLDTGEAFYSDE